MVQIFFHAITAFPFVKAGTPINADWILLVPGIVIWICAVVQFLIEFPKEKLIASGVFSPS